MSTPVDSPQVTGKSGLCPVCGRAPAKPAFQPFCSRRCADIDLGRWLKGGYVIAADPESESEKSPAPAPNPDET